MQWLAATLRLSLGSPSLPPARCPTQSLQHRQRQRQRAQQHLPKTCLTCCRWRKTTNLKSLLQKVPSTTCSPEGKADSILVFSMQTGTTKIRLVRRLVGHHTPRLQHLQQQQAATARQTPQEQPQRRRRARLDWTACGRTTGTTMMSEMTFRCSSGEGKGSGQDCARNDAAVYRHEDDKDSGSGR